MADNITYLEKKKGGERYRRHEQKPKNDIRNHIYPGSPGDRLSCVTYSQTDLTDTKNDTAYDELFNLTGGLDADQEKCFHKILEGIIQERVYEMEKKNGKIHREREYIPCSSEKRRMHLAEYQSIVDHLHLGICLINTRMEILNANRQMFLWYPHLKLKRKPHCYNIFRDPLQDDICLCCPLSLTLSDGQVHESITSYQHESGLKRNGRLMTFPVYDGNRKIIGGVKMVEDITEQMRVQKMLRESESIYRTVFEMSETPSVVVALDTTILMVNKAFESQTGYPRCELEGKKTWKKFFPGGNYGHVEEFRHHLTKASPGTVKTYETHMLSKDGQRRDILMNMVTITGTMLTLVSWVDITEKRTGSIALAESERNFRELVQNANSIIYRRTSDGIITFINRYAQLFFGYEEDEIVGKNVIGTIVPVEDSEGRDLTKMIHSIASDPEHYVNNENENMLRSGERVWIAWTNKVICDERGAAKEIPLCR